MLIFSRMTVDRLGVVTIYSMPYEPCAGSCTIKQPLGAWQGGSLTPFQRGRGRESMANMVLGCCLRYPFVDREGRRITWSNPEHVRDSADAPSCAGERSPASG
jgi:hypothetical protein